MMTKARIKTGSADYSCEKALRTTSLSSPWARFTKSSIFSTKMILPNTQTPSPKSNETHSRIKSSSTKVVRILSETQGATWFNLRSITYLLIKFSLALTLMLLESREVHCLSINPCSQPLISAQISTNLSSTSTSRRAKKEKMMTIKILQISVSLVQSLTKKTNLSSEVSKKIRTLKRGLLLFL